MTSEFLDLLSWTTATALDCFKYRGLRRGLLTGSDVVSLWQEYYEHKLTDPERWHGVYFIFYRTSKEHLVPVYVGQGQLLSRIVSHLGAGQYVAQVLAFHFGGIHSRPWLLEKAFQERFRSLSIGMAFAESPEKENLEEIFIRILRPITNNRFYTTADLAGGLFGLEELAKRWLSGPRVVVADADLRALRSAHEVVIGRVGS